MKLGKKTSNASADAKPAGKAVKSDQKQKAARAKFKRLTSVATSQALVVVLAGLVIGALLQFLVMQPAAVDNFERQQAVEVKSAALRLNQHLELMQAGVNGLSSRPDLLAAARGAEAGFVISGAPLDALPGIRSMHVFPLGEIPRSAVNGNLLGFAGLELARKAEKGAPLHADAFPRDNQWYVQMASPVRDPATDALLGSLLVIFDSAQLKPLLKVVNSDLGGRLSLVQTVSGAARTLVSQGSGSGDAVSRELVNPDWSVSFSPARAPEAPVDSLLLALLVGAPLLLAALLVWLLLGRAQRSIRQEVASLVQWSHKAFGGERIKLPAFNWDAVASLGEALQRLSQGIDRRAAKAAESARQKSSTEQATGAAEEPLFQDKNMLDIDMLDGDEDVLGFGGDAFPDSDDTAHVEEVALPPVELSAEIFRAYDIRGIVGETLTAEGVQLIGRAIGSQAMAQDIQALCIGYDGRHSSPELADALARGIMAAGCDVIHVGAVPTPVLYFATHELQTGSGVMVTGSHNPANYNGLKIMLGGTTLSGEAIQKLYQRTQTGDFTSGQGSQSSEDVRRAYLDRIVGDIAVAAPLKVVLDAGNGIAGELGPLLIEELGCEVIPLYCEVDGDFPNHHPDPGKPANLQDLIDRVKTEGADLGLAFDGDGDRVGVVTNSGKIIWPDRLLMLLARDVVSRNPGADVLYDVKCSRRLAGVITEAGGRPIMWKTGHSLMKAKMKETGALLAGEMSGHIFFGERWYGFDDGLYAAARLLEILGIEDRHSDEVFQDFPEDISTPELNVEVTDAGKFEIIERLAEGGDFGDGNISSIDGIRVDYADGWGLCRASNTTPVLVLRFEAETETALARIQDIFREQLAKAAPDLDVNF